MCLATPSKIIKIEGEWAEVQSGDHTHKANLSLVKNVKIGDYVIVHENMVLNKIETKDAEKILNLIKNNKNKNICTKKV
jgi:hydrogenase expression/formation protein HypC